MRLLAEDLLLLGGGLLGGLLCRLLRCWLLGSLGLGGLLGGLLCRLLRCWLLGSLGLGGLLGGGLLGLGLLGCGLLGGQLEASCSLLASGGGGHDLLGGDHLPQGELDAHAGLGGVHLVVGHDVLEDGLAGGSLLVLQPLDGSGDHAGVGGVGSGFGGLLGLGGLGSGGHGFDLLAGTTILPMY